MDKKTNAERFIEAYNTIDQSLRFKYNYRRSMSFSDVIRRSVPVNYIIRRYEDYLIDYGRLRNAIIHKSNGFTIAEPHDEALEELEKIAKLVSTPPSALESINKKNSNVIFAKANNTIKDILKIIDESSYSNIPIYDGNILIGVANGTKIINKLGE